MAENESLLDEFEELKTVLNKLKPTSRKVIQLQTDVLCHRVAFTWNSGTKLNKTVVVLDETTGEPRKIVDERFDFQNSKTVVIRKDIHVFF